LWKLSGVRPSLLFGGDRAGDLMSNALRLGDYLKRTTFRFPSILEVRGRGLMIGFDLPEVSQPFARFAIQTSHFTGDAKPNTIRLCLPWPKKRGG